MNGSMTGMKKVLVAVGVTLVALISSGCVSNLTGDTYSREDARTPQTVRMGNVENARLVQIEGTKSPVGTLGGAVIGGVAGSTIGGGRGSVIAATVGALAGGLAGSAAEEGLTKTQGVEVTVREDDGQTRAYVQGVEEGVVFNPGDRVQILSVNGQSRVVKVDAY